MYSVDTERRKEGGREGVCRWVDVSVYSAGV